MRTLGQERAAFALDRVLEIPTNEKENFESFSAGAPSVILQNGFGQALAFWYSKKNKDAKNATLLNIIKEWLVRNEFVKPVDDTDVNFIRSLSGMNQREFHAAGNEALLLLEWVKRYANAGF